MQTRTTLLAATTLLSAMVACTTNIVERQAAPSDPTSSTDPNDPAGKAGAAAGPTSVASTVSIDTVSLYQGVEVHLVKDGADAGDHNAPIITNRPALVRVHATKASGSKVSKVTATLHIKSAAGEKDITDGPKSITEFTDNDLASTFNFQLDATQVTSDLEVSVKLEGTAATDAVKYPADDSTIAVGAVDAPKLRIVILPYRYDADGSGRLPDLSEKSLTAYHDALYKMYPVSDIEMTVHDAVPWPINVDPTGDGWDDILQATMQSRQDEAPDDDVYYIGVFNPADSLRTYCKQGCVLGVAPASNDPSVYDTNFAYRTALIVGYQTDKSGGTIAQELAHAMARLHAPCGNPAAIDKKYPYKDAALGSSGWDVQTKDLVDADGHTDFMSYCFPAWVSDYTFKAINDRMVKVKKAMGGTSSTQSMKLSLPASAFKLSKEQIAWTMKQ